MLKIFVLITFKYKVVCHAVLLPKRLSMFGKGGAWVCVWNVDLQGTYLPTPTSL